MISNMRHHLSQLDFSVENSGFTSGVTSSCCVSQFKEAKIYGRTEYWSKRGSSAPAAVPGSAPVLWGGFQLVTRGGQVC